ncbi:hypothetical protein FPHOBKDP_00221 [Listeria phage LPJP1]|nr:hypothetical protein FPHOBKDP_00221 [Listeria phage LPJP1]
MANKNNPNDITDVPSFMKNAKEDTSSVVKVNQTSYDVHEHWLKMASTYFNIDDTNIATGSEGNNAALNLLKTGFFGYFNEIAAHEVKNSVYNRNVLYDEHFLNSASFPDSIFNYAKLYNVPLVLSNPSHMLVNMVIRKEDLINSPLREEIIEDQYIKVKALKTYQIILDREFEFSVGKFKFQLPYDVQILMKQNQNNDYTITARYLIDEVSTFPYIELSIPEIKVYQSIFDGEKYMYLNLDIYQVQSSSFDFDILSEDISDNLFYTAEFDDQLAGFNIYYTYMGEKVKLNAYFNNTFNPSNPDEKFCYYTFVDDNKLQISFSSLVNNFRPRYNSKITIEILTTKGSEGNFTFDGEVLFNFTNSASNNFSKMLTTVVPITSASGGNDKLSTSGMKDKIIETALGRDNLIMDTDLDIYFRNIDRASSLNDSSINFMKKRNDVLQRLYNAFLLLRDNDKKVIPTNTASSVTFSKKYFTDQLLGDDINGYVIPEHSLIQYDYIDKKYKHLPDGYTDDIKKSINDKNTLVYTNPFLVKIDIDPVLSAKYYKLDIDETFDTSYSYLNNLIPTTMIINKLNITKIHDFESTLDSDTYTIKFDLNSNETIGDLDKRICVRGILMSKNSNKKYGYFEFERENPEQAESTYTAKLSTNRKFNKGLLSLSNSLYDENGDVLDNVFIDEDLYIKIGILYKDNSYKTVGTKNNNEIELFDDEFPDANRNIDNYVLALSVTTNSTVKLYRNLSSIMTSTVTRVGASNVSDANKDFKVEMIPLISLQYFIYEYSYLYTLIESYITILSNVIPKLENNTTIDMKFYNSWEPSKYYYLNTEVDGDSVKYDLITRIDMLIDLTIHTYEAVNDNDDLSIKKFISDFIEACNTDGIVPISNLLRLLEEEFAIISYIEYNGLSGNYDEKISNKYQKILNNARNINDLSKQEIIEYVPEYINIKKTLSDNIVETTDSNGKVTTINLGKKYEHVANITYQTN